MRFDSLQDVPPDWPRSAVCIGVFDGVHRGHREVIRQTISCARSTPGAQVVALTFDPHPSAVVRPDSQPSMLTTVHHRVELLTEVGVDAVLVLPFTKELSSWSPERFVDDVLVNGLHTSCVVVGDGFRFGHRASGDVTLLRAMGAERDFEVVDVSPQGDPAEHIVWSSTYVRQCVAEGDVALARQALNRPHRLEGSVIHGDHRGRDLGYPTANLKSVEHAAVPADGVYAGWLVRGVEQSEAGERSEPSERGEPSERETLPAAISIGTNPTFDGIDRRVEAYVLDQTELDLYGEYLAFDFAERLRPTLRFDGVEPLLEQMADDVQRTRSIVGTLE
jgi:riboflavin kinase/FMN adenylyltransferase